MLSSSSSCSSHRRKWPITLPGFNQITARIPDAVECDVSISVSVGFARFPEDGSDSKTLLQRADERMYEVKRGRHAGAGVRSAVGRQPELGELATRLSELTSGPIHRSAFRQQRPIQKTQKQGHRFKSRQDLPKQFGRRGHVRTESDVQQELLAPQKIGGRVVRAESFWHTRQLLTL